MQKANQILQAISKLGEQRAPLTRVYRSLYCEELYLAAYAKIYKNDGALTPGTGQETADGTSLEDIRQIIDLIRYERYRFRPVRRSHVDKKKGGKRPLGLPNWTDKLVQEVMRMILEAYYEPRFRESSHGFRPQRGCHTALTYLHHTFRSVSWFIEGDIRACFDSIDHEVLLKILARDIHDGRFLNLIGSGLKAGVVEEWEYKPTLAGVPQGGIISPLLSNIYLHELDTYIEEVLIPRYTQGDRRARNPKYRHYEYLVSKARREDEMETAARLQKEQRQIPSMDTCDPHFRRLRYVRYADDFMLGFIGPKHEAEAIKQDIGEFLKRELHLEMSSEKTLITHARTEHALFLGYAISIYRVDDKITRRSDGYLSRSTNGAVRLGIPYGLTTALAQQYQYKGKSTSELRLLAFSDATIIDIFQARFRGIANYYQFAVDRCRLSTLKNIMQESLVKTLAHKYKLTVSKVYRNYRSTREVDGLVYRTLSVTVPTAKGERDIYWGAIPLKRVQPSMNDPIYDQTYRKPSHFNVRSELIERLQRDSCELCGKHGPVEVHHIRKLADLKQRWAGRREKPEWVKQMIAMRRKTLIVCQPCHVAIHAGRPVPKFAHRTSAGEPDDGKLSRPVRRGDDGKVPIAR